uniref:Uncharacterized protein n=1 Tax=Steinernema glaseri TaxID=37863 RepID=A0A1I7YCY4_9BILA
MIILQEPRDLDIVFLAVLAEKDVKTRFFGFLRALEEGNWRDKEWKRNVSGRASAEVGNQKAIERNGPSRPKENSLFMANKVVTPERTTFTATFRHLIWESGNKKAEIANVLIYIFIPSQKCAKMDPSSLDFPE